MTQPSIAIQAWLDKSHALFIGGQWRPATSGQTLDVYNPATAEVISRVPAGDATDIDAAVGAAREAFRDWRKSRPAQREKLLLDLADALEARADDFALLETLDNGKPITFSRHMDVALAIDFIRYTAGWATKIEGRSMTPSMPFVPEDKHIVAYTRREPIGVVGAIIPWNFPLLMATWKIAPALAAGCSIVLKPAEDTPLTALLLAELAEQVGFPAGTLNVVTGLGHTAGAALASHPGINKVAFTGSTPVGKQIGHSAMENLTRTTLELGGKSPVMVLADADVEAAAAGAAQAIFFNQGQVCTAGSRIYVHESIHDAFVTKLAEQAQQLTLAPGCEPTSSLGPLVSSKQQQRVLTYIEQARSDGGTIVTGGGKGNEIGYFVEPTVITGLAQESRCVQEEIFGPVVVVQTFRDLNELVLLANDSPYGLAASIWSNDLAAVNRLVPEIEAGSIWVNGHNLLDACMPFGGFKQSGIGRELGDSLIEHYTEQKSVVMIV
ncbi:aldehyde dehydrogenase family protein [Vreelandella venusta]|uniref:aldehyde dehydrogenase family protein n=1 Tax=Vreelandella venusta TaxID=44935 RepID=UPI0022859900|nr:aldehyde dehydrogenase family protein [Halomonas venusta]WAM51811.1 aldehyde dehydrogenase family protein [Halomonas venusta]